MGEKLNVRPHMQIKHHGLFNQQVTYDAIRGWFFQNGYVPFMKGQDAKSTGQTRMTKCEFNAFKDTGNYHRFWMKIWIISRDEHPVAIERDGKQITVAKGRFEVFVNSWIEKDYKNFFTGKSHFWDFIRDLYEKLIAQRIDVKWEQLSIETDDLEQTIKDSFY
ncbi:MAG: hypothetical protein ABIF40_05510 [archaeon]